MTHLPYLKYRFQISKGKISLVVSSLTLGITICLLMFAYANIFNISEKQDWTRIITLEPIETDRNLLSIIPNSLNQLLMSTNKIKAIGEIIYRIDEVKLQYKNSNNQIINLPKSNIAGINSSALKYLYAVDYGNNFSIKEMLKKSHAALISPSFAKTRLGINSKETIGKIILLNGIPFKIIGIISQKGFINQNQFSIYIPILTAQELFNNAAKNKILQIIPNDNIEFSKLSMFTGYLKQYLQKIINLNNINAVFNIYDNTDEVSSIIKMSLIIKLSSYIVAFISILLANSGLLNLIKHWAYNDKNQLLLLKAIGYKNLALSYVTLQITLICIATLTGIIISLITAVLLNHAELSMAWFGIENLKTNISLKSIVIITSFILSISCFYYYNLKNFINKLTAETLL